MPRIYYSQVQDRLNFVSTPPSAGSLQNDTDTFREFEGGRGGSGALNERSIEQQWVLCYGLDVCSLSRFRLPEHTFRTKIRLNFTTGLG